MKRYFVGLLCILLLLFPVQAQEEGNAFTFGELGHDSFEVSGTNREACTSYSLGYIPETGKLPILSLHFSFAPLGVEVRGSDVQATLFLNQDLNAFRVLGGKELAKEWVRVHLPRSSLTAVNEVKVCLQTSNSITGIRLLRDSMYGNYITSDFSPALAFRKSITNRAARVGEEFEITVTLENHGSLGQEASVLHRLPELEESQPFISILRGETQWEGVIPPCAEFETNGRCLKPGKVAFSYVAKSNRATQLTLLPAILRYTNIFGEQEERESTRETVFITQPNLRVRPVLLSSTEQLEPLEKAEGTLTVKNEGDEVIYNTVVFLEHPHRLVIEGSELYSLISIQPGESKRFTFQVYSPVEGDFELGCRLSYLDLEGAEGRCEPVQLSVKNPGLREEVVIAAILLIVGVIIYAFLLTRKS